LFMNLRYFEAWRTYFISAFFQLDLSWLVR
jgi:hypothetical protein